MTIRHLKIFLTVAECGKMRKAAEILYISQPSVSQAIRELETHYNVKLFERLSQKLHLTYEGNLLLSHARHIVDAFENMELDIKNAGKSSKVRIGASVSVGTSLIHRIINKLNSNIDVFVTINNTSEIESMILKSELDIGIVEGTIESNDIISIPICTDELVMIAGRKHHFFDNNSLQLKDLDGENIISRESGSADRNQFEQFLNENNIHMVKKWTCTNTEAIKNAVIEGDGIAIISKMLIEKECSNNTLKILNFNDLHITRKIKLAYHKNKYLNPALNEIIDLCLNYNNIEKRN